MLMRFAGVFTSLVLLSGAAFGGIINLNTGAAGSGWNVTQTSGTNNGPGLGVTAPATVLTGTLAFAANLPGFEAFAWANPFGGAVWIGQLGTDGQFSNGGSITCGTICGATSGDYVYTLTLPGSTGGSVVLNGFTGDNGVRSLTVNQSATSLYACTSGGPGTLCAATRSLLARATISPLRLLCKILTDQGAILRDSFLPAPQ
jgi:hypothetical protein